jgi:hypothetical protein
MFVRRKSTSAYGKNENTNISQNILDIYITITWQIGVGRLSPIIFYQLFEPHCTTTSWPFVEQFQKLATKTEDTQTEDKHKQRCLWSCSQQYKFILWLL